ncbi:MAG: transposase [Pirellulales bacterium]
MTISALRERQVRRREASMALGRCKWERQKAWIATTDLPRWPGHPFYKKLNQLLAEAGFDAWLEALCAAYYADGKGRKSIPPGTYFRMILIGYFEGIASQRGIAWRCADSRSLAEEAGLENPTDEDLRRFDGKRSGKKVSNDDWQSPSDAESRIAKIKNGRTQLAHKADHVVDAKTDLVLVAVVNKANRGDAETLAESVVQAQKNIIQADSRANIRDVAADKGYHAAKTLALLNGPCGLRTCIPEPKHKRRWQWRRRDEEQRRAVTANRSRVREERGKRLKLSRSELSERSFAHVCETVGCRRC